MKLHIDDINIKDADVEVDYVADAQYYDKFVHHTADGLGIFEEEFTGFEVTITKVTWRGHDITSWLTEAEIDSLALSVDTDLLRQMEQPQG